MLLIQTLSGTLPECFGHFTALEFMTFSRQTLHGSIPSSMNSYTSMRSMLLFSNMFECDAPGLDASKGTLGQFKWESITYLANDNLGEHLLTTGGMNDFAERSELDFNATDPVLLFTGNPLLTTHASAIEGESAPPSIEKDALRRGQIGIFPGEADWKQLWYLMNPMCLLFFVCSMIFGAWTCGWSKSTAKAKIRAQFAGSKVAGLAGWPGWELEVHTKLRQKKYLLTFGAWPLGVGCVLLPFFNIISSNCTRLSDDVTDLGLQLTPWRSMSEESFSQYVFILCVCLLYVGLVIFIRARDIDLHAVRNRRAYSGECHAVFCY